MPPALPFNVEQSIGETPSLSRVCWLFAPIFLLLTAFSFSSLAIANSSTASRDQLCPPAVKPIKNDSDTPKSNEDIEQELLNQRSVGNKNLDWVEAPGANRCGGYYLAPGQTPPEPDNTQGNDLVAPSFSTHSGPLSPTQISADNIAYDNEGETVLTDNVLFFQGNTHFYCDKLNYNTQTSQAKLQGDVEFRLPGLLILADQAEYSEQSGEASFENSQFVLHDVSARGQAGAIQIVQNEQQQTLLLEQSYFSVCPPTQNDWALAASELDIDYATGRGKAWHARVLIKDVPVLYLPYIDFPIDDRRKTGFLFPSFSGGSEGFEYKQSYYINLAPNYDLTYTPHYIQEHGLLNSLEGRYKNRYSEWNIGASYIDDDKQIDGLYIDETASLTKKDGKRWGGVVIEKGQFGSHWRHSINYAAVSDVAFLRDWGGSGLEIGKQDSIQREARLDYLSSHWQITMRAVDFEQLELDSNGKQKDDQFSLLPEFTVNYRSSPAPWQLNPIALARVSHFDHSSRSTAIRSFSHIGVGFSMSSQAYQLTNEVKVKGVYYDYDSHNIHRTDSVNSDGTSHYLDNNGTAIATYKLDSQLFFERHVYKDDNSGFTHTLTPRLQYYYAPFENQLDQPDFDTSELSFNYSQVFREERFTGFDRISDAQNLSLGIDTGVFNHSDGRQVFTFGAAQVFYYADRRVLINDNDATKKIIKDPTLSDAVLAYNEAFNEELDKKYFRSYSDFAVRGQYFITPEQSILLDAVYDPSSKDMTRTGIYWHYQHETGSIANLGYAYESYLPLLADTNNNGTVELVDQDTTSADISFYTPLSSIHSTFGQNWAIYGRLNWDLDKNETIENLGGFKYDSCCWSVLFAMQRERRLYDGGTKIVNWENSKYENHWFLEFELKGLGGITSSIIRLLEESIEGFNR